MSFCVVIVFVPAGLNCWMLRKVFGLESDIVTGGLRKLPNEELYMSHIC